jgi:hypothetical protein
MFVILISVFEFCLSLSFTPPLSSPSSLSDGLYVAQTDLELLDSSPQAPTSVSWMLGLKVCVILLSSFSPAQRKTVCFVMSQFCVGSACVLAKMATSNVTFLLAQRPQGQESFTHQETPQLRWWNSPWEWAWSTEAVSYSGHWRKE